jgi:putative endonuclease
MKHTVYVLSNNKSGKIYIGYTNDLNRRLAEHNDNNPVRNNSYTHKNKGDWKLIYSEVLPDKYSALKREKQLKSHQGREFIRKNVIIKAV